MVAMPLNHSNQSPPLYSQAPQAVEPDSEAPLRILMADDAVRYHRFFAMTITEAIPSHVDFAADGDEALQKLRAGQPPDLLILDLNMPKRNGEDVLRNIRQDPTFDHMPVMILTGDSDNEVHRRLLDLGADDFVEKGASPELLVARIRNQVRHKLTLDRFSQLAVDMDMFAAGVLHDIRNLESTIVAICQTSTILLEDDPVANCKTVLADIDSLEKKAHKLGSYAAEIIKMVRETQRQQNLSTQDITSAMNWVVDVLATSQSGQAPSSGSSPNKTQGINWEAPIPLEAVIADPHFLKLALLNIVANSVKYARPDATPHITLTQQVSTNPRNSDQDAVYLVTRLRDNGMGIKKDDLRRVFEPFMRGAQGLENKAGFGLGLAMVAKVITNMGGRVWAELPSDNQPGTVICIELRRGVPSETQ